MWRALVLVPLLTLASCATMMTGTHESITISSSPSAAGVTLECGGQQVGTGLTPTTITIRRNAGDCSLKIAKDGFADQTIAIEQGVNPAYWTNFLFSPLAPGAAYALVLGNGPDKRTGAALMITAGIVFATDFWTGAAHAHRPKSVDMVLKPRQ
jgi:hypothetical protein